MRMDAGWSRDRFIDARVARLATADGTGRPHLVPIVFALLGDDLYSVVDHKPKSGGRLRRLANIDANPAVSVLVDRYDDDWDQLWWARADGTARILDVAEAPMAALTRKYRQYRDLAPPGPLIAIAVQRWSGWSAARP